MQRVIALVLLVSLVTGSLALEGWLIINNAFDAIRNIGNTYSENYGLVSNQAYEKAMRVYETVDGYVNKTSNYRGSTSGMSQSMADDFTIPNGYTTTKLLVALGGIRSWSALNPQHPRNVSFGILRHHAGNNTPDTSVPPIIWITKRGPVGDWHNMTLDWWFGAPWSDCTILRRTSTGNPSQGLADWFELDVSGANGGTGISGGHYWLIITATVGVYADYMCAGSTIVTGNSYSIYTTFNDVAYGSDALRPTNTNIFIDPQPYNIPMTWDITSGCRDRLANLAAVYPNTTGLYHCNLAMNVYIYTTITGTEPNLVTKPLPPSACTVNITAAGGWASKLLACPGPVATIMGTSSTLTPNPSSPLPGPVTPTPPKTPQPYSPMPTPTSSGAAHTIVQLLFIYGMLILTVYACVMP